MRAEGIVHVTTDMLCHLLGLPPDTVICGASFSGSLVDLHLQRPAGTIEIKPINVVEDSNALERSRAKDGGSLTHLTHGEPIASVAGPTTEEFESGIDRLIKVIERSTMIRSAQHGELLQAIKSQHRTI
jgi:hypothetical protein